MPWLVVPSASLDQHLYIMMRVTTNGPANVRMRTARYIGKASAQAKAEGLNIEFIQSDMRTLVWRASHAQPGFLEGHLLQAGGDLA